MSVIAAIIDTLDGKLKKLFDKIAHLEQSFEGVNQELGKSLIEIANQSKVIETLKKEVETLKITNSLLGSDDNKRDTKLKINSLIREIDYCIAQLSD